MLISERGHEYGVKHFITSQDGPLSSLLFEHLNIDTNQFNYLIQLGSLYLGPNRLETDVQVRSGDYIRVHTRPRRFPPNHYRWDQRIIFENSQYLVVNKPSGLPCHSSVDNTQENLLKYLKDYLNTPLYMTHRLDVPTSGLIVLAKTLEAQSLFNKSLEKGEVEKKYLALVSENFKWNLNEVMIQHMEKSPKAPKVLLSYEIPGKTVECRSRVTSINYFEKSNCTLIELKLLTGRTHQLRSQLSFLGHPIYGDTTYGSTFECSLSELDYPDFKFEKIALTATEINFKDPVQHHHIQLKITPGFQYEL